MMLVNVFPGTVGRRDAGMMNAETPDMLERVRF